MSDLPTLSIMLLTYAPGVESPRHAYALRTLGSTLRHLRYRGPIHVHIADDGSPPEHVEALMRLVEARKLPLTTTDAGRSGYGASYNAATQTVHAVSGDYGVVLPLEDDWELTAKLDVTDVVRALTEPPGLGCVRLGYIGTTQELRGHVVFCAGWPYLKFDPESPEPHVFAGHPRLESVYWERYVGPWPEGLDPGSTEFTVAQRPEAREGVGWPLALPGGRWVHIGTVQARDDQRAAVPA